MNRLMTLVVGASLLAGCGTPATEKTRNGSNKTVFRYNESAGISHLDPARAANFEDNWAMSQLFNGLVQFDRELNIMPAIARKWEVSANGLEYTFYLRNDVFFHDNAAFEKGKGRKVVAADFVHSFMRICDPETASPGQYIFQNVDAEKRGSSLGFEAVNDTIFKIYLKAPQSDFLMKLSLPYCSVIPYEAIEAYGEDFRRNPVGTGPFKFKLWQEDVKLVMVRNENYFEKDDEGNRLPYVDAINVSFVADKSVEVGEFIKGRFEFISGFHPSIQTNLLTNSGKLKEKYNEKLRLIRSPWLKTDYIGILIDPDKEITQTSALRSREIRRAINYAIDRKGMVRYFRSGIGIPAETGFIPEGMPGYSSFRIKGYTYDPDKAKELLFESGLNLTEDEKKITVVAVREYKELCEYLRKELEEIGFDVRIELVPTSVFKEQVASYKTNFFRKSWTGDYPDPMNFLQLFYSKNKSPKGPNYTHFSSSFYDNLYEEALKTTDQAKRMALFRDMEQIIFEEAPVIPLFYDESVRICQSYVTGIETNAMNTLDLKRVRINKKKKK